MQKDCDPSVEELRDHPDRPPISVIITTFNEEVNIAECIESVLWADEILLVDSYSSDRTVEIANRYPIKVLQRQYYGSAAQKNWALGRVHHQHRPDVVRVEEFALEPATLERLRALGHEIEVSGQWSNATAIAIDPRTGVRTGAADPRGVGDARAQ